MRTAMARCRVVLATLVIGLLLGGLGLAQMMAPGAKANVEVDDDGSIMLDLDKNVFVAEGNPRLVYQSTDQRGTLAARNRLTFKMVEGVGVTNVQTEGATDFDWTMPGPKRNGQPTKRHLSGRCSRGARYDVNTDAAGKRTQELVTLMGSAHCEVETIPDPDKSLRAVVEGERIEYDATAGTVKSTGQAGRPPRVDVTIPPEEGE